MVPAQMEQVYFNLVTTSCVVTVMRRQLLSVSMACAELQIVEQQSVSLAYCQVLLVCWCAQVKTSDVRGAGTDANVTVTLIGSAGSSGPHKLVRATCRNMQ
jgi:hypothetical protein